MLLSYDEVRSRLGATAYVLLGNGFSIGCDPIFQYQSLYRASVENGLSDRAQAVFERLGTSNFEGVLRLMQDTAWVAALYGVPQQEYLTPIADDIEVVKTTLIDALASTHLEHTGKVPEEKKKSALAFLHPFRIVFTTNYDLLAYWVVMSEEPLRFQDGFREDEADPDGDSVVFSERLGNARGLLYLHGGLHLYLAGGDLHKRCWSRTQRPLIELVREGLNKDEYPVFVAEGSAESKLSQIQRVGYLWYALDKLSRIESPLVVYGHSLGESDAHISEAIARNLKLGEVYIGVHGGMDSPSYTAASAVAAKLRVARDGYKAMRGKGKALDVHLFSSETAQVWG